MFKFLKCFNKNKYSSEHDNHIIKFSIIYVCLQILSYKFLSNKLKLAPLRNTEYSKIVAADVQCNKCNLRHKLASLNVKKHGNARNTVSIHVIFSISDVFKAKQINIWSSSMAFSVIAYGISS